MLKEKKLGKGQVHFFLSKVDQSKFFFKGQIWFKSTKIRNHKKVLSNSRQKGEHDILSCNVEGFEFKGPGEPQEQHDHGHAQEVLYL